MVASEELSVHDSPEDTNPHRLIGGAMNRISLVVVMLSLLLMSCAIADNVMKVEREFGPSFAGFAQNKFIVVINEGTPQIKASERAGLAATGIYEVDRIGEKYGVAIPVLGHAGDGNLHAIPLKNSASSVAHWEEILPALLKAIYAMTSELGGAISGEHGIGHKRRDYMSLVMSEAHLDMMRKIKRALDPKNILNPGKVFNLD